MGPLDEDAGIYVLVLHLCQPRWVVAGQLGRCRLEAGWYVYVGSAKRNLKARLARHLRREKRVRWHIDYLRGVASVEEIWLWRWTKGAECRTNGRIRALPGASVPWKGFGSSDCACFAHLTQFAARPALQGTAKPQPLSWRENTRGVGGTERLTTRRKGRILISRDSAAQQRSHRDDRERRQG